MQTRLASARHLLGRVGRDTHGVVAIIVGLTLPVLAGFGMLGIDVGFWYFERRDLQTAADAAALSAAWRLADGQDASMITAATADAVRNGFDSGRGTLTLNSPPTSGPSQGDANAVQVQLSMPVDMFYARVFGSQNAVVNVVASAEVTGDGDFCMLSLDPSLDGAITARGNATLEMDCGIAVNSSSSSALRISGSPDVDVTNISIAGGLEVNGNPNIVTAGGIREGARPALDPYADLVAPLPGACDETGLKIKKTKTISPGTYCGGLDVTSQADLTMEPGLYIFDGGEIRVNGQARIQGTGVTLVLTGSGGDYATMRINGGSDIDLSAPTTGPWQGVLIYQDRNAPANHENKINGGSALRWEGVVYFPAQAIEFTGNNGVGATCLHLVARQITLSGSSAFGNDCEGTGVRDISVATVRLSE